MTNNQREFQREVNRIMREMEQLQQQHHFKHIPKVPEQPKRITRTYLNQLKNTKGKDLFNKPQTSDKPKSTRKISFKEDDLSSHKVRTKHDQQYIPLDERKTRSDKGTKRDKPSPLKGRPSPLKGTKRNTPSPLKGRPSPLKGKKRGKLTAEKKARRNAKRQQTLALKGKTESPLKGTHLSDEEKARRNAKRKQTIAIKQAKRIEENIINTGWNIANLAPRDTAPTEQFNAIEWILSLINNAIDKCANNIKFTSRNRNTRYDGYTRMGYLMSVKYLVESNADNPTYYATLKDREEEISKLLNAIAEYLPDEMIQDTYDPNTAYTELYQLLSPSGEISIEVNKQISEESEEYVNTILAR